MALLKINALEKHFRTPEGNLQNVLNIDSFSLDAEEQMALKGQSGSGKTTFLHLIAGIISPDSGTILLDGHPFMPFLNPTGIAFEPVPSATFFRPSISCRDSPAWKTSALE